MTEPDLDARRVAAHSLLAWWQEAGVDAVLPPPNTSSRQADPQGRAGVRASPGPGRETRARTAPRSGQTPPHQTKTRAPSPTPIDTKATAHLAAARAAAAACQNLDALRCALDDFTTHPLAATATHTVFARGTPGAAIMVIGEAPGREEDETGLPFIGRSGRLLDAAFTAAGLNPATDLYVTHVVNWRPPADRAPSAEEISLCLPYLQRHVALAAPHLVVLAGGVAATAVSGETHAIARVRGRWLTLDTALYGASIPAMAIFHPAYVLRRPIAKRQVWLDVLSVVGRAHALQNGTDHA